MTSPRPRTSFEVEVSDEQVAFFREQGYLGIDRITTDEEVAWLGEVFDELYRQKTGLLDGVFDLARPYGAEGEPDLGQLLFPEQRVPDLHDTVMWRNARHVASRLLGHDEAALQSWGHLIAKAPRHGAETPWHQDEAYWDPTLDYDALGAWVPLDDADEENGCLWFLPGSHRGEVLPHRHLHDDPNIHVLLTTAEIDTKPAVPVPLRAGGASFHHRRMIHYAGPNHSDRRRRAWSNEFQTEPVRREQPTARPWVDEGREALEARFAERAQS